MRKFSVGVAIFLSVLMMAGSVFALNAADHVKIAPNGKGDLIIFPWFFAYSGGYESKLTVINTSATDCVVAKVIYRTYLFSEEVLDHLIYLSPNDVWTGTIKIDSTGKNGMLFSDDDSILVADGVFATKTNPVNQTFVTPSCANDANNNGYVEVIEAASADYTVVSKATPPYPVPKTDIYKWYSGINDTDIAGGKYPTKNVLAAYQENRNGVGNALKQAVVFADYRNQAKLTIAQKTNLGQNSANSIAELEAAIAKAAVNLPFKVSKDGDMVVHTFTYPTKMSYLYSVLSKCQYVGNAGSPFWSNVVFQGVPYKKNIYDLTERSPETGGVAPIFSPPPVTPVDQMYEEVTRVFAMYNPTLDAFTEGWVRFIWTDQDEVAKTGNTKQNIAITFTGTPVIPSVLYQGADGNWTEAGASYTDGKVTVGGVSVPYYQYK